MRTFFEYLESKLRGVGPMYNPKHAAVAGDVVQEGGFEEATIFLLKVAQRLSEFIQRSQRDPVGQRAMLRNVSPDNPFFAAIKRSLSNSMDDFYRSTMNVRSLSQSPRKRSLLREGLLNCREKLNRLIQTANTFLANMEREEKNAADTSIVSSPLYRAIRGMLKYLKQGRILETFEGFLTNMGIRVRQRQRPEFEDDYTYDPTKIHD